MNKHTKHKFNIFPSMNQEEYEKLKNDIKNNGFDSTLPITLYDGEVLDGWNRYTVCSELNITPTYVHFTGTQLEAINFVLRTNKRRNITSSQWAAIAVSSEDIVNSIREEVERNRRIKISETLSKNDDWFDEVSKEEGSGNKFPDPIKTVEKEEGLGNKFPHPIKTAEIIAEQFNTNDNYVKKANKIKVEHPDLFDEVFRGEKTITEVEKEINRERIKNELEKLELATGEKKYRIIYADPPWKYGNNMPEYFSEQADHYTLMTVKEICDMPVKDITQDNAVLFLWVTSPILEESFQVIKAWGFKYKSSFIWDKVKHNMGHYNSVRHELLLICTKGSCTPDVPKLFDSVQTIERTEHSKKPEEFRNIIDTIYPAGNRIELFRRGTKINNWDIYGNQVQ